MRYMKMMKCLLPGILSVCSLINLNAQKKKPVDFVNPLIGTGKSTHHTVWESNGAVFPAVLAPFGMVQIAPDGYFYSDKTIRCFSFLNHCSGWFSLAGFHLMAYTGPADSL